MTRIRMVLLALFATIVLVGLPTPSEATNLATLNLSSTAGKAGDGVFVRLTLSSDETGTGHLRGHVAIDGERFVAQNAEAQSRWADLDGDGVAGVTHIASTLSRSGQSRTPVAVTISSGRDIDQSGDYQIDITIDGRTYRVDVRAAITLRQG